MATATPTPAPQLQAGRVQQIAGLSFRLEAAQADASCAGHAYDQVSGFFQATDCTGLSRALYSTTVDGHPMVVAVSKVRMPAGASLALLATGVFTMLFGIFPSHLVDFANDAVPHLVALAK